MIMTTLLAKKTNNESIANGIQPRSHIPLVQDESDSDQSFTIPTDDTIVNQPSTFSQTNLLSSNNNLSSGPEVLVANTNTDWINKKWRPLMGYTYMLTCICDFILFPILWSLLQAYSKGQVTSQWQPVTLMGAGLFHVSMGAILGVTAFMRSKEKIEGKA